MSSDHGRSRSYANHTVQLYDNDASLIAELTRFATEALATEAAVLVLATEEHRKALRQALRQAGMDVAGASARGQYVALDAGALLARIMRGDTPDAAHFNDLIAGLIDRAAGDDPQRPVAIFGELVALLSAEGNHRAAVALEGLWHALAQTREFSLFCAYPMRVFPGADDSGPLGEICAAHDRLLLSEETSPFAGNDDDRHAMAILQQKARALEREVVERRRAQELLQRREVELANVIEEVPTALHWVGPDGTILWANRSELEMLGYAHDEYVGHSIAEFHADADNAADILERLRRRETLHNREAVLRHKDGSVRHVLINSNALWEDGEFVHIRCVTRDMTDRVLADEANARLAALVDSSDDAIISKTLDGIITSWNRAAERLYGYSAAEMIGRPIATIVPAERRAELDDILARLARGERIANHETERVAKDGRRVEVSVTISPIHDRKGRVVGASKIARDISDRRALERQKQAFLEMVAHDLGSPMTVVKGYAQLLQRRQAYDERAVTAIIDRAAQMGRLVADMLEMTRLEAGHLELRRSPVDLAEVAHACAAQASLLAGGRNVQVQAPPHPIVGEWDGDRLAQILTNLLDNAMKYAPEGEITVQLRQLPHGARVAVIDQGPGLAAEELPRIFEHFFRAPRTASATAGAGLGLYICKALVEAHGGRLWAESTPGQGSTFACDLPTGAAMPIALTAAPAVLSA